MFSWLFSMRHFKWKCSDVVLCFMFNWNKKLFSRHYTAKSICLSDFICTWTWVMAAYFATITASTLLGWLSLTFRGVFLGISEHFSRSIYQVRCWTRRPVNFFHTKLIHPYLYGPCFVHREHVSMVLESSGSVLYATVSDSLRCAWWCEAWLQLLGHKNPRCEALCTVLELIWRPCEVWSLWPWYCV